MFDSICMRCAMVKSLFLQNFTLVSYNKYTKQNNKYFVHSSYMNSSYIE